MNYIKIQSDIIKALDKKENVVIGVLKDGDIAVTLDNYVMYKIPKDKFYIDINKIHSNQLKADTFFTFDTEDAIKTNELRKINHTALVKIKSAETYAWVDEKLLKCFDKNCSFALSINNSRLNPIKIFENEECVGILLPFRLED